MAILFGIIVTYVLLLYLAGIVMAIFTPQESPSQHAAAREPVDARHDRDAPEAPRGAASAASSGSSSTTTIIVTVAFWVWFAFKAGSPLPNQ